MVDLIFEKSLLRLIKNSLNGLLDHDYIEIFNYQ